jgi:hypothetical protein
VKVNSINLWNSCANHTCSWGYIYLSRQVGSRWTVTYIWHFNVDFLSRLTAKRDGASSQLLTGEKDCDSSDKTASDVAVDDGFLALLNSALPLSNIRVMVS